MKIRELLDSPEKWTRGAFARDAKGKGLFQSEMHRAVCWCFAGAIDQCYPDMTSQDSVWDRVEKEIGSIAIWNDHPHRTYADVIALATKLDI